jgi:hypothetical protein
VPFTLELLLAKVPCCCFSGSIFFRHSLSPSLRFTLHFFLKQPPLLRHTLPIRRSCWPILWLAIQLLCSLLGRLEHFPHAILGIGKHAISPNNIPLVPTKQSESPKMSSNSFTAGLFIPGIIFGTKSGIFSRTIRKFFHCIEFTFRTLILLKN